MKILDGNFYTNLYKFSWEMIKSHMNNQTNLIVATNAISLAAGISFNFLRETKINIEILHYSEELEFLHLKNKVTIILVSDPLKIKKEWEEQITFYFNYVGKGENILLC